MQIIETKIKKASFENYNLQLNQSKIIKKLSYRNLHSMIISFFLKNIKVQFLILVINFLVASKNIYLTKLLFSIENTLTSLHIF